MTYNSSENTVRQSGKSLRLPDTRDFPRTEKPSRRRMRQTETENSAIQPFCDSLVSCQILPFVFQHHTIAVFKPCLCCRNERILKARTYRHFSDRFDSASACHRLFLSNAMDFMYFYGNSFTICRHTLIGKEGHEWRLRKRKPQPAKKARLQRAPGRKQNAEHRKLDYLLPGAF